MTADILAPAKPVVKPTEATTLREKVESLGEKMARARIERDLRVRVYTRRVEHSVEYQVDMLDPDGQVLATQPTSEWAYRIQEVLFEHISELTAQYISISNQLVSAEQTYQLAMQESAKASREEATQMWMRAAHALRAEARAEVFKEIEIHWRELLESLGFRADRKVSGLAKAASVRDEEHKAFKSLLKVYATALGQIRDIGRNRTASDAGSLSEGKGAHMPISARLET
jgi:hypothetical protein